MVDRHTAVGAWRVAVHIPAMDGSLENLARFSADGGTVVAEVTVSPCSEACSSVCPKINRVGVSTSTVR